MKGHYIPCNDDGYSYVCPDCKSENNYNSSEQGCDKCGFSEEYVDDDEWYEAEMKKPVKDRAWNNV